MPELQPAKLFINVFNKQLKFAILLLKSDTKNTFGRFRAF
jgi:hypothetical protein